MRGDGPMVWRRFDPAPEHRPPCLRNVSVALRIPYPADAPLPDPGRGFDEADRRRIAASLALLEGEGLHRRPSNLSDGIPSSWVPGTLRFAAHRLLGGGSSRPDAEREEVLWPADPSGDMLHHLLHGSLSPEAVAARPRLFALTVDVDTPRGTDGLGAIVAEAEALGLPVTAFVTGEVLSRQGNEIASLLRGGHELALHGWRHDRLLDRLDAEGLRRRFAGLGALRDRFALAGFRAPNLLRSPALDGWLAEEGFWDSSVPDADVATLLGPFRGSGRSRPHRRGRLAVLPLTLPLDDRLLLRGFDGEGMARLWGEKLAFLDAVGGVAVLTLHGEPHLAGHPEIRQGRRRFLEALVAAGRWRPCGAGELLRLSA